MAYNKYATDLPREQWHSWDPMLLSGTLFFPYASFFVIFPQKILLFSFKLKTFRLTDFVIFFLSLSLYISLPSITHFSRGIVQRSEYIQFIEISLHIFRESTFGATAGVTFTYGHGYYKVLFSVRARAVRIQQRFKSIALVRIHSFALFDFHFPLLHANQYTYIGLIFCFWFSKN